MPDFLETMAIASRERAAVAKMRVPAGELRRRIADLPDPPRLVSSPGSFDLIAEVKRSSPSLGPLDGGQIERRARSYAAGGAAAISVLTEPVAFGGSLEHLRRISAAVGGGGAGGDAEPIPTLRKDFITDPYQLLEARASGAGGALLVLRLLTDQEVAGMIAAAAEARLFLLFEAFDGDEIDRSREAARRAHEVGVEALVGLNCRDLRSLEVRPGRFRELAHTFPDGVRRVAESGIQDPDDAAEVAGSGFDFALVGTALMKRSDPGPLVAAMLEAGRAARVGA